MRWDSKVLLSRVLLKEAYILRCTKFPSTKGCYEDRLTVAKHNGGPACHGGCYGYWLLPRSTSNYFLEPRKEYKRLDHEREFPSKGGSSASKKNRGLEGIRGFPWRQRCHEEGAFLRA